ncbi:MAG: hypothetical protein ABL930_05630 [Pseudobdellovibrio sp.]
MEDIAPPLVLLWDIKRALEKGQSVSFGVRNYLKCKNSDPFQRQIEMWWLSQHNQQIIFTKSQLSYHRCYLLEVLEQGLKGQSILQILYSIETELIMSCENEINARVARLPLLSLMPLTFLIFPSLLMLLVAPLLKLLQF